MVAKLARDDFEDLRAEGLSPTLDDFDRLNQLALRLAEGAETTCANFPRVGWAGDVPFFQPTLAAFAWYYEFAARLAADDETANTFWFFALAHARDPKFFERLQTRDEIAVAVKAWKKSLPVTLGEIVRACRYAVNGFDDAKAGKPDEGANPRFRADRSAAAENLKRVEDQLVDACAKLKCPPEALMGETQTRLDALCAAAAVELGRSMSRDEARLRAAYDLALREITRRLKAEKESDKRNNNGDGKEDDDGGEGEGVPPFARTVGDSFAAGNVADKKPEDVVVVVHGANDTTIRD